MKRLSIFIFLVLVGMSLKAQNFYFTDTAYVEQLNKFLEPVYEKHPEVKEEYEKLKSHWNQGNIENFKFGIVYISNTMRENFLKPYPYFYDYISSLNALIDKNDMDYYREWEVGLLSILLTKNIKNINEFLTFSQLLIKDSILYQNNYITWKAVGSDYTIGNDPNTEKLYVNFNNDFKLVCYGTNKNNRDSIIINDTKGVCYPVDRKFVGEHGRISWKKFGYKPEEIFAKFNHYDIDLYQSSVDIQNVRYTNSKLGVYNVSGDLKISLVNNNSQISSPVFSSDTTVIIKKLFPGLEYHGYLLMKGRKVYGTGKNQRAIIYVKNKGKNLATIRSFNFELEPHKRIYSGSANFTLYLNHHLDSLYHNNLEFKYMNTLNRKLFYPKWFLFNLDTNGYMIISRSSGGAEHKPLIDSYHKLSIFSDKLVWKQNDSLLYFVTTVGTDINYTTFESFDYFDEDVYDYFSGTTTDHLNHLAEISVLYDSVSKYGMGITPKMYQEFIKKEYGKQLSQAQVRLIFQKLDRINLVEYNRDEDEIIPTEKLNTYLSNSARLRLKKEKYKDFDKLRIVSMLGTDGDKKSVLGTNAILNLKNNDLNIFRVEDFKLGPTVKLYVDNITVKKDREMHFSGRIGSGLLRFTGGNFVYHYDQNSIDILDSTSQMEMWFWDSIGNNQMTIRPITTIMKNVTGKLYVSSPKDKSNTLNKGEYPKFVTNRKPRVIYNLGNKDYSNKEFFFEANNFVLDSLNLLTYNSLKFPGEIVTNLMRPLPVTLKVFEQNGKGYLGFKECTNKNDSLKSGLNFKNGKFFGCFYLNDKGLFGDGSIIFGSTHVWAKGMAFIPEQVRGFVDSVKINTDTVLSSKLKEDIPKIIASNVNMVWSDAMHLSTIDDKESNFWVYKDKLDSPAKLKGSLNYGINNVTAEGSFDFKDAVIADSGFVFLANSFSAENCNFNLKNGQSTVFKTSNLKGNVDINKKLGSFYSNGDTTGIYFHDNDYMVYMDHFLWKIGEGIVNIGGLMPGQDTSDYATSVEDLESKKKKDKNIRLFGTILQNVNDTLTFSSSTTVFDINKTMLIADGVHDIKVADALVHPSEKVKILRGGMIDTLKNVNFEYPFKIFSDNKPGNYIHSFHDADVVIVNRFNYFALHPVYTYPFEHQEISFDRVASDPKILNMTAASHKKLDSIHSIGFKTVGADDNLDLNGDFVFHGTGTIYCLANNKNLKFEGYAQISNTCDQKQLPVKSFRLEPTFLNTDTVKMPMSASFPSNHGNVESGLYWAQIIFKGKRRFSILSPFVGHLKNNKNYPIFEPEGEIYYNPKAGEYRISNENMLYSLRPDTISGNLMAYNKDLCLLRAQGSFNLFLNWDARDKLQINHVRSVVKGFYRNNVSEQKQSFQVTMGLDFIAPEPILSSLADQILQNPDNQSIFEEKKERTTRNYNVFLGKDTTKSIFEQLNDYYDYSLPKKLKHTITFSDLNLVFNQDSGYLASVGPIGISNIDGKKVDRYVKGYVKYRLNPKTRMLIIIIEPSDGVMYAFKYRYSDKGVMKFYLHTGIKDMDQYFDKLKKRDKKFKNNYQIEKTNLAEIQTFAREYFINKK